MNVRRIIHDIFQEEKRKPFSWEDGGCLSFPGKVAKALTGKDPTEEIRQQFSSKEEAKRLLVENGCKSLRDMAAKAYPEIPVAQAMPGDWAVVQNEDGTEGLGVVVGSQVAVRDLDRMGPLPLDRAVAAFQVMPRQSV